MPLGTKVNVRFNGTKCRGHFGSKPPNKLPSVVFQRGEMSVPVWARDNRSSPENRPLTVFTARGKGSAPESEGRSSLTGSSPFPEGATIEATGVSDPGGNGPNKSTKRAEPSERPAQGKAKLGKTEGFFALGAWSARLEIARLLATGVPADEIVAEIHSGQEGEDPLVACSPFVPCPTSRERSHTPSIKMDASPDQREPSRSPGDEPRRKAARPEGDTTGAAKDPVVKGVPSWAAESAAQSLSFGRKVAVRPGSIPQAGSTPADEPNGSHSEGYSASLGQVEDHEAEVAELDGVLDQFTKRAGRPEKDKKPVKADPYIPRTLPRRTRPLEALKLEQYRIATRSLFEDMVILEVPMDLVADVSKDGIEIDDKAFTTLTDPKSPGTGLRYSRLMKRLLAAHAAYQEEEGAPSDPFGQKFMQSLMVSLIQDDVGFRTPQSLLYAVEFYSGIFGFACPGAAHPRVRKLAREYICKAPEREPAPYFEVGFLLYLEKVVLDATRDLQTRVACGKLRLCTQASIRHSDLAGTAMADVEWCRMVGESSVLGLRAKAAHTKSGPRPWAAALLGVSPDTDSWLICLAELLLSMHGPGWKHHSFVGCAADGAGGFLTSPPLIDEDVLTVKRALKDDLDRGNCIPMPAEAIGHLRWHSCKTTLPTYMTHFGITARTVRFQGAWKKQSQLMPDLYLREAQTLVIKGQMEVLDQVRRGAVVQAMEGRSFDLIPMKPDWRAPTEMATPESSVPGARDPAFVAAMEKAVVCAMAPGSEEKTFRPSSAASVLSLPAALRDCGASDEESLAETAQKEALAMSDAGQASDVAEVGEVLNELDSVVDSDDSEVDPADADMDLFGYFVQLASGSGKIHKPANDREDYPACRSHGTRYSNLKVDEDWGLAYRLCTKCFGGPKGDECCPLLCDFLKDDKKTGEKLRCGRRCDPAAVEHHKLPSEPGFSRALRHRCAIHSDVIPEGEL